MGWGDQCLQNKRGYLFVMDKRVPGERGKFQSRVDGVVGPEGRGRSARVMRREDWTGQSAASGEQQMRRLSSKQ